MNQLFLGDNLAILKEMPDNSIDLIATDPPFNTGRDWGAFSDKWGGIKGYLKFMEPRCVEMHRVLKETGSFYLHCDPTASHYLKVMLDGIFGIKQFRNEIVWCYEKPRPTYKQFRNIHDILLFYSKSNDWFFNMPYVPKIDGTFEWSKPYKRPNGSVWKPKHKGKKAGSWWADIRSFSSGASYKQRTGYPTQKPLALYQRIIKASSNEGDTVLDPFAGSGTTLDAAASLNRKWIGIDQNSDAIDLIENQLTERHALFMREGVDYEVVRKV